MFNAMRGVGHAPPAVPPDAGSARSPQPATAAPPRPSARAACSQMLQRARVSASTALRSMTAPRKPPPPSLPAVGRQTTVFDTVAWNNKATLAKAGNAPVVGNPRRTGDPRLGPAQIQADAQVALGLHTDPHVPVDAAAARRGREAIVTLLDNTEREFGTAGTNAGREIDRARAWLNNPATIVTARDLGVMMKAVGDAIHLQGAAALGTSDAARTAGRMPMECMTHLGHQIRAAMATATPAQRAFLQGLGADTLGRVLRHDMSFGATRAWLQRVQDGCQGAGLGPLAQLAGTLAGEIPAAGQEAVYATRLHDNIYGRALESKLMAELVRHPPPGVARAVDGMAVHLHQTLHALPANDQVRVANQVQAMMRSERRSWQTESPKLEAFARAAPGPDALRALKVLLSQPARNGADCIAIPYLTVKLSLKLGGAAPWMPAANVNYRDVVGPASARATQGASNPNRMSQKAGITAHHQPPIAWSSEPAMHPGDRNTPLLDTPSPELSRALEHGVPFVSGVSGSTNIAMHMVDHMRYVGKDIDARDALLGTMMFLTHDGGHSMHEAMWVGNQLEHARGLPLGLAGGAPADFVADYGRFLGGFAHHQGGAVIDAAVGNAWNATLDHFGRHSHYSPERAT